VGLAKREELVYVPGRSAPVEVPQIALNVLMRVRDEAHKTAIRRHRNFRSRPALGEHAGLHPRRRQTAKSRAPQTFWIRGSAQKGEPGRDPIRACR